MEPDIYEDLAVFLQPLDRAVDDADDLAESQDAARVVTPNEYAQFYKRWVWKLRQRKHRSGS